MIEHKKRTTTSVIFSHLSREERIDKACELLAVGVLRLAEKRGLLRNKIKKQIQKKETTEIQLYTKMSLRKRKAS